MESLWASAPLLNGPGVPVFDAALDLFAIHDMTEHWCASRGALHPSQAPPRLEPGLGQWLPLWRHWRPHLRQLREAVAEEVVQLVEDCSEEVHEWFATLKPHVKLAYGGKQGQCNMKLPVIKLLAAKLGWGDMALFEEMHRGFPLLGHIRPGLGWRLRGDSKYAKPQDIQDFFEENHAFVQKKLRRGKVDPCWRKMADEIAADVELGRMEGPFAAPASWCKTTVPLASHAHAATLMPAPEGWTPCSFAFAVRQIGSDGREKIRRAEDWRQSGANKTVGVPDTPAYHGIEAFLHLARAVKRELNHSVGALRLWLLKPRGRKRRRRRTRRRRRKRRREEGERPLFA